MYKQHIHSFIFIDRFLWFLSHLKTVTQLNFTHFILSLKCVKAQLLLKGVFRFIKGALADTFV